MSYVLHVAVKSRFLAPLRNEMYCYDVRERHIHSFNNFEKMVKKKSAFSRHFALSFFLTTFCKPVVASLLKVAQSERLFI